MILFAVRDRKSCVCEYFLAQSDVDALRIWFVMVRQSPQMYAFLEDFDLVRISEFATSMETVEDTAVAYSGERLKQLITERSKKESDDDGK